MIDVDCYFVFDVESIGLHGEGFAFGAVVVTLDGVEVEQASAHTSSANAGGGKKGREWVRVNVPKLYSDRLESPRAVRNAFWEFWAYWQDRAVVMAADCTWPVEANFLSACVADDPDRAWKGPYPLIDVASVRMARGFDPLETCERLESEPAHDPMGDARHSARLLVEAMRGTVRACCKGAGCVECGGF